MIRSLKITTGKVLTLTLAIVVPARADGPTLRGIVVAAEGGPAAGARVWTFPLASEQAPARREAVADAQGRFALPLAPGEAQWHVAATLGDQGGSALGVAVGAAPDDLAATTIRLQPRGRLRARLVEAETGRPLAGARLALNVGLDPTTDADGRLEVAGLGRVARHQAIVVAPGRERHVVLFEMADGPTTDLEVAVPPGGKAVGRVLDTAGRPVPGARVGPIVGWAPYLQGFLRADVAADGRFEFDGLPVDRGSVLVASAPGHASDIQSNLRPEPDGTPAEIEFQVPPQPVAVGGGFVFNVNNGGPPPPELAAFLQQAPAEAFVPPAVAPPGAVPPPAPAVEGGPGLFGVPNVIIAEERVLPPAATRIVTGVVVDLQRRPVSATVRFAPGVEAKTDAAGRFRLAAVPDVEEGTLTVIPDRADLAPEVEEIGGGEQDLVIVNPPGRTATGVVRDELGAPLAGVEVVPRIGGIDLPLPERGTRTDNAGRFAIAGLPDSPATAALAGPGLSPLEGQALGLDGSNEIVMTTRGAILGRVVDAAGRPVRNFRVLLNAPRGAAADDSEPDDRVAGLGGIGLTVTAADGAFVVRDLAPGLVRRVTILAPGYGEATIDRVVAAPPSRWAAAGPAVFRLPPPRALRVRVVAAATGRPIPDARVALLYEPNPPAEFNWVAAGDGPPDSARARADAAGVATFDPLSYAEARVLVRAPGFARRHLPWRDGVAELTIPLDLEGVVVGSVLDAATGGPIPGTFVYLVSPTNGQLDMTPRIGDAGRFRFAELPAGDYSLAIWNSNGEFHREEVRLGVGEHAARPLRLTAPPPPDAAVVPMAGEFLPAAVAPNPPPPEPPAPDPGPREERKR